jgi:hypothetical protein
MKPLNALYNVFPRNPTETAYMRFLKGPEGDIKTAFSESRLAWDKEMRDRLKTPYEEMWRGGVT